MSVVFEYRCGTCGRTEETDRPLGDTLEYCPTWSCDGTPRRVWSANVNIENLKEARA